MRIPVVDLKPFLYGAPSERLGVARGFGDALETTGFAVIVGHDVPEALASETYATMKAYFALPLEAKLRDSPPEKTKGRGYLPIGIESVAKTLAGETLPDLCEALVFPNPLAFAALMVVGLYLSLWRLNFLVVWLLAWVLAFLLPTLSFMVLNQFHNAPSPMSILLTSAYDVILAVVCWFLMRRNLAQRRFVNKDST